MARVKRLVEAVKFKGPLATASDCTKVKKRLSYSNDFGSHVLGSVLLLEECEVKEGEDIDEVVNEIKKKKSDGISNSCYNHEGQCPCPHTLD